MEKIKPETIEKFNRAIKYMRERQYTLKMACEQAKISQGWFRKIRKQLGDAA